MLNLFLAILPVEFRQNFTLIYKSESHMQQASPEKPRVLMFGSNGRLQITFNADRSQKGERTPSKFWLFCQIKNLNFANCLLQMEKNIGVKQIRSDAWSAMTPTRDHFGMSIEVGQVFMEVTGTM